MGMDVQLHALTAVPTGNNPGPAEWEILWAPKPVRMLWRTIACPLPEFETRNLQPAASSLHQLSYPGSSGCTVCMRKSRYMR